ncbi:hypothetical protein GC207_04385 [bacterium]|nr:hypothetical protein [bacterium]
MTPANEKFPRSLLAIMAFFSLLVIILPLVFWFRLDYYEVCPTCAREREVQDWLIPFTRTPYYTYTQIEDTPLTAELAKLHYVDQHQHHWLIIRGVGPGNDEIIGEGVRVAPGLITPAIAPFVELLHKYTDPETEAYWFARMTHPQQSDFVRKVAEQITTESFADGEAFRERLRALKSSERRLLIARWGRVYEPQERTPPRLLYQRTSR